MSLQKIKPEDVLKFTKVTAGKSSFIQINYTDLDYLCPLESNTYNIQFLSFTLRDLESQKLLFEVRQPKIGKLVVMNYSTSHNRSTNHR